MTDLSQVSTDDLKAYQAGDLKSVSTAGLIAIQSAMKGGTAAQASTKQNDVTSGSPGNDLGAFRSFLAGAGGGFGRVVLGAQSLIGHGLKAIAEDGTLMGHGGEWIIKDAQQGRAKISQEMTPYKEAHPWMAGGGEIGGEVIGTLPVGGVIGNALSRVAPMAGAAAPIVNKLASAAESGGMRLGGSASTTLAGRAGDAGLRALGGAMTGGASAGLIDPESAGFGAVVGGLMPGGVALAGGSGRLLRDLWKRAGSGDASAAESLAKALGLMTPQARQNAVAQLRQAETLVPGSSPTAAQALQTPEASILQRVVHDSPGGEQLRNKLVQQSQARSIALEGVAPTNVGGLAQARHDFGTSVQSQMIPEEARLAAQVRAMYEGVDPQNVVRIGVPVSDFESSANRYLGPGSFGQGSRAQQALDEARAIGTQRGPDSTRTVMVPTTSGAAKRMPQQVVEPGAMQEAPAPWSEVRRLRSSINDAWQEAKDKGRSQEAAALNEMRRSLDARIDAAAGGAGQPGDIMPTAAANAYREANRSFSALQDRFHTGPQNGMFRRGGDGLPVKQGGEVASAFWGNRPGLAEDVQSFKRLVDDQPGLMGQFKSLVTTHGAATSDAAGNLTTKFSKWVDQTLPGLHGAFTSDEVQTMQRIAQDIDRAAAAQKLGTSLGGSNTYQNAANALNLGVLDSKGLDRAAGLVPGLRLVASPALDALRGAAKTSKAASLAELLSDNGRAANALERVINSPNKMRISDADSNALTKLLARSTPALATPSDRR